MHSQRRDPDRLLPADPAARSIARGLHERVRDAPILSPHGHVPATLLVDDPPFVDAADLFLTHDHYITRLLHAMGADLADVRAGSDPREAWRLLASQWHRFAGTASGYWVEEALDEVFGIDVPFGPETADELFDSIGANLARPEFRPRALFERFRIELMATTDDPLDDLAPHAALAASGLGGRVVPTFRPDKYIDPDAAGFATAVPALLAATGYPATFEGYLQALEARREHFARHGAVSTDHGVEEPFTADLDAADAERLFQSVRRGSADAADRRVFRGHMLLQMARMSVDDGLVMTLHAGVLRNHSSSTFERFGADTGHDIPVPTSFTRGLRPLLERFGLAKDFHLVLFTVDETTFSRELAPLAGFYPGVYVGAPWWFLDSPDAMGRYRAAVTETAGFYRTSGFIDDTRAFLSIPARHDTARRADAAFLADLVVAGRLSIGHAERIADDLVSAIPREVFKL
ncbi:glucuronate isomerase (plasmid) [Rathayibacter sp. VKM Ac-2803]|uniref:Uronate isomerase n=1 Tax=Rathayibacter caricis DSM 15933 TaxID=1328867 RepID=A0A2T4UNP6_9MICO|nr:MULTISPECIES: glucuronate isomerase [Rathayibacter]MWV51552.1 glucuronate isomerase [Rathayibacter sp. VKM Ac-2803]PTL71156.1 glucuronate isomerase [Rathayibacter caricis DSM 15933]